MRIQFAKTCLPYKSGIVYYRLSITTISIILLSILQEVSYIEVQVDYVLGYE